MFKKVLIPSVIAVALMGTGFAVAAPSDSAPKPMPLKHVKSEKREQIKTILKQYRSQIMPLRQKAKALRMQLNGKMVTQGTSWDEIAAMSQQLNALHGQVMLLKTKARFEVYQKTGIILPMKHKRHGYGKGHHAHR